MENAMKPAALFTLAGVALIASTIAQVQAAPVAGSSLIGVTEIELRQVATGWSTKHQVLGQSVYNDQNEKIGAVDDVIFAPDKSASYAIVGAGGFLGIGKHDVAIPVSQFKQVDGKFVVAGATKDALKAMPAFEYAR
jgi:sporulation protein YlmC with PRC-barrel domain